MAFVGEVHGGFDYLSSDRQVRRQYGIIRVHNTAQHRTTQHFIIGMVEEISWFQNAQRLILMGVR